MINGSRWRTSVMRNGSRSSKKLQTQPTKFHWSSEDIDLSDWIYKVRDLFTYGGKPVWGSVNSSAWMFEGFFEIEDQIKLRSFQRGWSLDTTGEHIFWFWVAQSTSRVLVSALVHWVHRLCLLVWAHQGMLASHAQAESSRVTPLKGMKIHAWVQIMTQPMNGLVAQDLSHKKNALWMKEGVEATDVV